MLQNQKDKRYNNQIDNYIDKYKGTFKLGLVYAVILAVGYGVYELYKYFFN